MGPTLTCDNGHVFTAHGSQVHDVGLIGYEGTGGPIGISCPHPQCGATAPLFDDDDRDGVYWSGPDGRIRRIRAAVSRVADLDLEALSGLRDEVAEARRSE